MHGHPAWLITSVQCWLGQLVTPFTPSTPSFGYVRLGFEHNGNSSYSGITVSDEMQLYMTSRAASLFSGLQQSATIRLSPDTVSFPLHAVPKLTSLP